MAFRFFCGLHWTRNAGQESVVWVGGLSLLLLVGVVERICGWLKSSHP